MEEFKSQKIKATIKNLLKMKGMTYEELAEELECSVPTVKRILGQEELSLNRLLQICDILDISLAELEAAPEDENKRHQFTEEQQEFFVKNRSHFSYLMKLITGDSPKKIAEQYGLTDRSTDKYLIPLENLGLIRVTGRQRVKLTFKYGASLGTGKLAKAYFQSMIENASLFFINNIHESLLTKNQDKSKFGICWVKCSKETYHNWLKESSEAIRKFEKLSHFEAKTKKADELMTAILVDGAALVKHDYHGLKTIEHSMGDIVNL